MSEAGALLTIFAAAFGAATLLPFQSEFVFVALQTAGAADLWALLAVASVGNTLGSVVNYAMGRGIARFRARVWTRLRMLRRPLRAETQAAKVKARSACASDACRIDWR